MWRLTELMVRSTLVTAWRLATSPTRISPDLLNATTDGVVREPSAFTMTVGSPPSSVAMQELVVPRSMPTARPIMFAPLFVVSYVLRPGSGCFQNLSLHHSTLRRKCLFPDWGGIFWHGGKDRRPPHRLRHPHGRALHRATGPGEGRPAWRSRGHDGPARAAAGQAREKPCGINPQGLSSVQADGRVTAVMSLYGRASAPRTQ